MKSRASLILVLILLAAAFAAVVGLGTRDPLSPFRQPDGSIRIPGGALTQEIQRALFGGNDLQPYVNLTYYAPARSPYPTAQLVPRGYLALNPNVFTRPRVEPQSLAGGIAQVLGRWFPPVDWGAALNTTIRSLFGLLAWDARATVTATYPPQVTDIKGGGGTTCTTSQLTGASDNAVLVLLSEAGTTPYLSVSYGTVGLSLIAGTAANGGAVVRTEIWGYAGTLPAGTQTMTATLSGGVKNNMTCATILLQGVKSIGSFINGANNTGATASPMITFASAVAAGNLAFAVAAIQQIRPGSAQPTAVAGTGAVATDFYGVGTGHCTGTQTSDQCGAGADIPNPGTAITWTSVLTTWVVAAVEVVATPACGGAGGGNCYRIGAGGLWSDTTLWSNTPAGPACGCTPGSTDFAIFNATPTGTTTLTSATTLGGLDMTGYTGALDTTAANYSFTSNGNVTIQGAFLARGSTIAITGNVAILGATTAVTLGTSQWTVGGTWTNNSTSNAWSAGGTVTIRDAASGTLTFGNLGVDEFNNLTLDASVAAGLTYTMAANALRIGGTLLIRNSAAGATGPTILDTSGGSLSVTAGSLSLAGFGAARTQASTVVINGAVAVSVASAYIVNTAGTWTVKGAWSDASTSASWSFAAAITFNSASSQTMTLGPQAGNEFAGSVTFDTTATTAVTYTMASNALRVGGNLVVQDTAAGATGPVLLDTSAASLAIAAAGLNLSTLGALNTRASTVTIAGNATIGTANAYITNTAGSWTLSGSWTDQSTSASWSFAAPMTFSAGGSRTMIFAGSNLAAGEFAGAVTFDTTAAAGVTYTMAAAAAGDSSLRVGGALTIRNGAGGATASTILDTSPANFGLTAASLTLGAPRGALRSQGSSVTIGGAVTVSDANSYLVLGSGSWTVSGAWTNNSTDGIDWSAGTGTLMFRSAANATMTFGNLGVNEANTVVFDTTTAAGITYTMATNGLRIAGGLTIQNTAATPTGNTVLTTGANRAVTAGGVVIGTRGTLTANGSTVTVNGSWTSTAANHAWNAGTSTVVFGATGTVTAGAGDSFNALTQSAGTTTLGSNVTASGAALINGTLDTSASNFTLTLQSTLSIGAAGVLNLEASTASTAGNVTIAAGGAVRFAGAGSWTINGSWTNSNAAVPASWAVGTATVRIVAAAGVSLTFWTAPAGNEFYSLVLDSTAAAGITYTQVNALRMASALTIQNTAAGATGPVTLDASASNYASTVGALSIGALGTYNSRGATAAANGTVTVAATGYIIAAAGGSWTVTGAWTNNTTSGSWSFLAPITFLSVANQTMTFRATATEFGGAVTFDTTNASGATYFMATNALTLGGLLTIRNSTAVPTGNTVLDTSTSNLGITAASVTIGTNGTLIAEGSPISVGGNWTVTASNATFTPGTSTVVFTATAAVNMTQAFYNLTVSAGTATLASSLTVNAALTVSSGVLAKGNNTLTANAMILSGGGLTSTSGNASITGAVSISSPASYIAFGSEAWTVGGSWSNASTSASWSVGTATVTFGSSAIQTMTFMAGASNEFYSVTFNSGATTMTYTMAGNGLRVANALVVQGTTGTTTLSTSAANLALSAVSLTVAAGGSLIANGSTITMRSMDTSAGSLAAGASTIIVNASGGTVNVPQAVNNLTVNNGVSTTVSVNLTFSGTLTLTSATVAFGANLTSSGAATIAFGSSVITIAGSWDTSSAGGFTATSSSVTFSGAAKTVTLSAVQAFAGLAVSGTLSQLSQLSASSLTLSAGVLTKGTNSLTVGGDLVLSGGALISTSGAVAVTGNVNVSAVASYIQFGSEAWVVGGSWTNGSTSASWSAGSGTITFNSASAQTMTFAGTNLAAAEFSSVVFDTTSAAGVTYTMAARGLNVAGNLTIENTAPTPTGSTILTTSAAGLPITASGTIAAAANGGLTANGSTITFQSFDTSSGSFNAGSSTLIAGTTGGTINAPQAIHNLTVNPGVSLSAASDLAVGGTLTVSGVFATLVFNLTVGLLAALAGGITAGAAGTKAFNGDVTVNAAGYFGLGGASWTFAGAWTNNSTSASWSAGTGGVTFTSSASQNMTFAALPGGLTEFHDVMFNAGASTVTFAMIGNPLVWSGALSILGAGGTTLATGGLGLSGGALSVGNGGALVANASSVGVTDVAMTGGTSGAITLTTGAWAVNGNWDTSGIGSVLIAGTSAVTFVGISSTIRIAVGQAFHAITIAGTISLLSGVSALGTLTVSNGATLTKTGQDLTFNGLAVTGTGAIVDGSARVVQLTVTNSDSTNLTTISGFSLWVLDGEFRWTHTSTVATSTLTFTIAGNTTGLRFVVTKDGAAFTAGFVDASGQVVFTMLGSDPVVDVAIGAPCGGNRYWVGGSGNWSDTAHWAATSGGAGGCNAPNGGSSVFFDGNSGTGTATVDQNASLASLNTAGWTGTLSVGTFNFSVAGDTVLAGGILGIGASSGTGLTVGGNLTLSGSAVFDGSGAASVVSVAGATSITAATAYARMGSGTWTFGGAWSNASTSASWGAGTGTVVFASTTSVTMTFASLPGVEFNNVTFASTGAGTITFTLGTNPLKWSGTLRIQDAAGSTTSLDTAGLTLVGGSLVVGNAGVLTANASTVTLGDVTVTGGMSGTIVVTTGSWTVTGNWDTSGVGSTLTMGTGAVTFAGAARTVRILNATNGFHDLTVSGTLTQSSPIGVTATLRITGTLTTAGNAISGGANLVISTGGALFGMSSAIAVSGVTMNDGSPNTLSMTSGSIAVSGSWDTSGAASSFLSGTSAVTLTAASGTIALGAGQSFGSLILTGNFALTTTLSASSLTLTTGLLTNGANALSVGGDLALSGGSLSSVSGDVTTGGNVTISAAGSYIGFGSGSWTIGGSWTNASTSSSWSAGTGTVWFDSPTSQTMTFAGTNLAGAEFNIVVFNGGSSTVAFRLAGPALRATSVTIQGGTGTTTVDTSGTSVPISADILTVAAGGNLLANASLVTVRSMDTAAGGFTAGTSTVVVSASGGTIRIPQGLYNLTVGAGLATTFASSLGWSATLLLAGATVVLQGSLTATGPATLRFGTASIAVAGSWDTSSAVAFASAGSSVTFTGSGQTIALGVGQSFATLIIAGSVGMASDLEAAALTVNSGGALTKTGHALAFNGLTVNGTIADGAVQVSNLTVATNDATALVSISAFTLWNAGSDYAWTHTASGSAVTITWTLGGNTSGLLYRVTKNGSSFADGTVDGSGSVVFTMGSSDPDMHVSVFPPPVPPWWQSPYFLAALPLPFLVVIAMFVQRQRWRPAKAFLVDERGQLLREFTLDPSCAVTYDQAVQAGALDAVEKDVRVAKYHARAVHGDMLSLIMLAVGPANVQEVEFARGLLQSVQDKLEDHARVRVEEARAEEASLETARVEDSEERADLQARARVFGDMVNAFTIARTKLDADSQKLRKLDASLREREGSLAEVRASLEQQEVRTKERQDELERAEVELKERQSEFEATDQELRQRERELAPKEKDVATRLQETSNIEAELAGREAALATAQAKLTTDLEDCQTKISRADALQAELADERKALDDLSVQMDEQQKAIEERSASIGAREKEVAETSEGLRVRLADLEPRERSLGERETQLAERETAQAQKDESLAARDRELEVRRDALQTRDTELTTRAQSLAEERKALDAVTNEAVEERKALDAKAADLTERESEVAKRTQDLADLKENLGPREAAIFQKETDLATREKTLAEERKSFQSQQDLVAAKALEIEQKVEQVQERETALAQEKILFQDAKGALEDHQKELEAREARFAEDVQRQHAELAAQEKTLADERARLTKEAESFEALRLDKSQWIASKEIELEAKEQGLADREGEIRAQAEENARRLTDLAAREEANEIEGDKLDKARAEAVARKAEVTAASQELEDRTTRFREEEAQKAEELRTWQATLDSEQALLKEQRETFEKEMQDVRESWAGRMIRVEQREEEIQEREAKVQADVEWVGRNEIELSKREKAAAETLKSATELQAEGERVRKDLEQRAMEVESSERELHEEAAEQSITLEKRTEALQAQEVQLAGQRAQWETELASQVQKLREREKEVQLRKEELDAQESRIASQEKAVLSHQDDLARAEERLAREKADLLVKEKQLETDQLELRQARERFEAESQRLTTEADAVRQSLAAKEADLISERERLERESGALQEKLGTKAKEMAAREKAVTAREEELRAEEQEVDARLREIESRERQAEAHRAELDARAQALSQTEVEQKARHAAFDAAVQQFEGEAATRQREWQDLQATLKSQEAQLAASTETRHAEIRKRMEDLEQRERSINATLTQTQIERTRLEAQAKAQSAKQAEVDAAGARADKRYTELKTMEEELLKARQGFESERGAWSTRRSEELKQLEATRDAAAEQTQQAERVLEDSQRRAYVAAEAEKAAKRQTEELAATQSAHEKRRAEAEKAEKEVAAQMADLRAASQRHGAKELELASKARDLDALQARLAEVERKNAESVEALKGRKASLDQEAERIATLAAQSDKRQAEIEARHAAVEGKVDEVSKREQILSTELQRADNLMEDLNRKEAEIVMREKAFAGRDQELAKREQVIVQRDAEIQEGMQALERLRHDQEARTVQAEADQQAAADARKDANAMRADAEKLKAQADAMQAEVAKNMRFLQKKALDVLDREEKIRAREVKMDEQGHLLESRAQILDEKDRAFDTEKEDLVGRLEKAKQESEKLRAKLAEAEEAGKSTFDVDEWKRDIENRVKIIQKKALDLLDREEKLRKKEEELRALAAQLGVEAKS